VPDEPVLLEVGRVGKAHGLRGEVHVVAVTNVAGRFAPGSELVVGELPLVVRASRPAGSGFVVRFDGIDDRNAAEALRGARVRAAALDAADGEVFAHEVIGAEVRDRAGMRLGRVEAVQANPAHDLLVLEGGTLIPVVFVVEQSASVVTVDVPEGLLDL
jgi:16S rRNA processing protein RimM